MKKNLLTILLVIFTGSITLPAYADKTENKKINPVTATAVTDESKNVTTAKLSDEEINCLVSRLNEIRDMDKKQLSKADKRALRKEVKDIKQILAEQDYVLYISLTALLLIILILILI
jgi:hypothetical protein